MSRCEAKDCGAEGAEYSERFDMTLCGPCFEARDNPVSEALSAARVDLGDMIRKGIPEREYVPGGEPWLVRGKRYLIPGPAGSGKSLAMLTIASEIVARGGRVAILDMENGGDEYARRLDNLQAANRGTGEPDYFAYPCLSLSWTPEAVAAGFVGYDVVVFDSSRQVLSSVGLNEDSNDDYARFISELVLPLSKAGIATVVLDNTGWDVQDRPRGASAKQDLNEVVYTLATVKPFDRERQGVVTWHRRRTRFGELPQKMEQRLGGGIYESPEAAAEGAAGRVKPTCLMEKESRYVEQNSGCTSSGLMDSVEGNRQAKQEAKRLLIEEGFVKTEPGEDRREQRLYSVEPYREDRD